MKTTWKHAAIVCTAVILLSGCSYFSAQPKTTVTTLPDPQENTAPAAGNTGGTEAGNGGASGSAGSAAENSGAGNGGSDAAVSGPAAGEAPDAAAEPETHTADGEFVGLADANSAEIVVDGEPLPFRFAEGFDSSVLADLDSGTKLELEYIEQSLEGDPSIKMRLLTRVEVK